MKGKSLLVIVFALILYWLVNGLPVHGQSSPKTLILLYSNNINGEIDPCPT